MMAAAVGNEQRREAPATSALQERVDIRRGKENAVLLPSATLCNLAALRTRLRPGGGFIADARVRGDGERLRAVTRLDMGRRDIPLALAAMRTAWGD